MDINSLLCTKTDCQCGHIHSCDIERVIIEKNAISRLCEPEICGKYKHILLVCDENTYKVAGERVKSVLGDRVESTLTYVSEGVLVPNEDAVSLLDSRISADTELILGVGSGVINDICKYCSFERGLPYAIVATAPSMDGYASKSAAMLMGGMKVTYEVHVPRAIVGDVDVLKNAPIEMIKSGYGDIIGKLSCLNDWRLSSVVNGEEICEYIYNLTYETAVGMSKMGKAVISRTEESIAYLMEALVIVGVAMAYMGNTRPASGSEHHLAHFFEITGLLKNEPHLRHGTDVAYATYVTSVLRKALLELDEPSAVQFDEGMWESEIRRAYLTSADSVISLQKNYGWIYKDRCPLYREKWAEIKAVLAEAPTPDEIERMLLDAELPLSDYKKTYRSEKLCDAVKYAKDIRTRYSVLWMYNDVFSDCPDCLKW